MTMKTTSAGRIDALAARRAPGLDTLRALAIVSVVVYHLNWRLPPCFAVAGYFGWMGVDLFFVLSGYLIGSQLLRPVRDGQGVDPWGFYRRRAYRILPAYLAVLALYVLWPMWREAAGMSPLWEFLTFTENLFVEYPKNAAFSHVWSLCVEEHFYLLLPLIVLGMAKRATVRKTVALLCALVLLGIAVRWYELVHVLRPLAAAGHDISNRYIERIYYPTYSRLDGLLAGVALALVRVFRPAWWTALLARSNVLLAAGAVLVGCAIWMFRGRFHLLTGVTAASTLIGFPVLSLGLAMWIPGAANARCWLGRMRLPGVQLLATLAFSLYLTHKEVAGRVNVWLLTVHQDRTWLAVLVYAVSCVAVAALLYVLVERPMLALRDRREARRVDVDVEARVEPAL
jgi:peptidoglycan/LPS O-acetylase OafA/YrhL